MCNWRSASPSGFAPHTPTSPSPPAAPPLPPPSSSPALPPLPASPAAVVGVVSASAVTKPLVFQPSCSLLFFPFFFFFAALLGVTRLLKQCWHLYQADLTLCPFPPSLPPAPLLLLHSRIHHTLAWESSVLHITQKKKKRGGNKNTDNTGKKKKKIQVFRLQQTAHENKHFPASSTWQ